jgi:IclR family acetate operon transcriptional repressor
VQSVERALDVLQTLAADAKPLRLVEVQTRTGLQKTIALRLLRTLESAGFVEQEPTTGGFQIGLRAFEVGQAYSRGGSLILRIRPHLQRLIEGSPHTAYLATLDGLEIVYLATVEGTGPLRVHVAPGRRNPAYATAVGKALLAELPDGEILERARRFGLRRLTPTTITSPTRLVRHLREVRTLGYALNLEEAYPGIGSIAATARDASGRAIAGISFAYATSLMPPDELPAWIERTTDAAADVSTVLADIDAEGLFPAMTHAALGGA